MVSKETISPFAPYTSLWRHREHREGVCTKEEYVHVKGEKQAEKRTWLCISKVIEIKKIKLDSD